MADRTIPAFKILRGSVGVGTALPASKLHVYGSNAETTIAKIDGSLRMGVLNSYIKGPNDYKLLRFTNAGLVYNEDGAAALDFRMEGDTNTNLFLLDASADSIGIGTNAPSSLLHVYGSSSYLLDVHQTAVNWAARIKNTSGGGYGLSIDTSTSTANNVATLACYTPSGIGVFVTNQGRLAVGLAAPTAALHVSSSASVVSYLIRPSASPTVHIGSSTSAGAQLGYVHANDYAFYGHDAAYNAIVVKSSGSVGIGTTNPSGFFQVGSVTDSSTTAASLVHLTSATASSTVNGFSTLKLDYKSGHAPSTAGAQIMFNQGYHSGNQDYTAPVGSIRGWKTGASDNYGGGLQFLYQPDSGALGLLAGMTLEGSGHVGIGTNAPAYPLHVYYAGGAAIGMQVKGTANRAKLVVTDNDTSAYVIAEDSHASFGRQDALSTNNLNINSDGSVGIGTNAASTFCKLNVKGAVRLGRGSDDLGSYNGDDFDLFVGYGANGSKIMLYDDQAAYHSALIQYGNALLRIGLNNSNSAPTMRDDSAINIIPAGVGIGIGVFTARLAVKSAGSTTDQIVVVHSGNSVEIAQLGQSANGSSAGTLLLKNNSGTDKIYLDAAGSSYFRGGSITVGLDDTGHDVRLYGATSGRYWEWDESMDLVRMRDNVKTVWGNGDDLQIYHDGNNWIDANGVGDLYLRNLNSSGDVIVQAGASGDVYIKVHSGETALTATNNGAVKLFFNGVQQCETLSNGLKINNPANNIGYLFGGDGEILAGQDSGGYYYATGSGQNVSKPVQIGSNASYIRFKTANTERVRITSTGLVGIGTASALASSGEQLAVYSASTGHSCFKNSSDGTGTVYIRNASQTANTWQPYLILSDSGGNRGGLALKYSTAGLKVHGQGGIEFWTGSSFGGGSKKFEIDSSGAAIFSQSSTYGIKLTYSNGNTSGIVNSVGGNLEFRVQDTEVVRCSTGTWDFKKEARFPNNTGVYFLHADGSATAGIKLDTSDHLDFRTGGANSRMVLDDNGNLGIGAGASPTSRLHVAGDLGNSAYIAYIYNSGSQSEDNGLNLQVESSGSSCYALRVNTGGDGTTLVATGSGNVGIGYTPSNITEKFCVNGKTRLQSSGDGNNVLECIDSAGDAMFNIRQSANDCLVRGYKDGGSQKWQIHSDGVTYFNGGSVGVGTDSPGNTLHVWNATDISPTSGSVGQFGVTGNGYKTFLAMDGTAAYFGHNSSGRHLRFMTNETTRLAIDGSGTYIHSYTHFLPVSNGSYTSGGSSNRWSNTYSVLGNFSSDVTISGNVGINGASPSSSYGLQVGGNAYVYGTFYAGSKSFLIDHPTKENKKLCHGSLEGPELGVYYRGRAQSNTITLPDYWTGLVRGDSITVQLTPKGSFQHLYVVSQSLTEIVIGAADGETIDCFYTVYGERADIDSLVVEKEV